MSKHRTYTKNKLWVNKKRPILGDELCLCVPSTNFCDNRCALGSASIYDDAPVV